VHRAYPPITTCGVVRQSGDVSRRGILLGLALLLFASAVVIAWLPPTPEGPLEFQGNPCDGSVVAAFEPKEADGSDPYNAESCRSPARRQLAVSGLLVIAGVGVLVVRSRQRSNESLDVSAA
jgi:hypothetical protein